MQAPYVEPSPLLHAMEVPGLGQSVESADRESISIGISKAFV